MGLEQLIPEQQIRARSHTLWRNEGCPEGRSEEFWFRAIAELEREQEQAWLVALEERENLELAMPKATISRPLQRVEAGRITARQAA